MAIIHPEGLFNGKRLRACSDQARLLWPYLFLASNGYGRIEIDYEFILRTIFVDFRNPPKSSEFFGILREYHDNGLLFLYESDGRTWGQWDCKPGSLPRYQTSKDRKSPTPPPGAIEMWKKSNSLKVKPLPMISEILGKFPLGIGVGVGVGIGVGEKQTHVAALPLDFELQPIPLEGHNGEFAIPKSKPRSSDLSKLQLAWFESWWAEVWAKKSRGSAEKAFSKAVKTSDDFAMILAATKLQTPIIRQRESRFWPHPATWLNDKRWLDEVSPEDSRIHPSTRRGPVDLGA